MSGANASLRAMFPDANPALLDRALEHCGGDVERAVDYLLANPPPASAESASAPPQVHAQTVGGEAGTAEGCRLRGTPRRSPVGFLTLFERQGEPGSLLQVALACNLAVLMPCSPHAASATRPQPRLHPHQVGSHLKRPGCAVFVLQSESHYSVLWAPSAAPDLELPSEESAPADGMEGYGDDFEADTEEGGGAPGPDELGDGSAAAFRWGGAAPFDGAFDLMYFDQMGEATEPVRVRDRCN